MTAVAPPDTLPPSVTVSPGPVTSPADDDLRVLSVLESALPAALGTADEPQWYTVPLVVSRQVTREERAFLEDPETARALATQAGLSDDGPGLRLVVSDRRLLVENTTLHELRDVLAQALGDVLRDLARAQRAEADARAGAADALASQEWHRHAAVHAVVESIRFE
jgi:hypothetical protein